MSYQYILSPTLLKENIYVLIEEEILITTGGNI